MHFLLYYYIDCQTVIAAFLLSAYNIMDLLKTETEY